MKTLPNSSANVQSASVNPGPSEGADLQGLPPSAAPLVSCLKMMPPADAAQLIAKLRDVVRTGSKPMSPSDKTRVAAEVDELSRCLRMMANSDAAISTLRGYASMSSPNSSDSFTATSPQPSGAQETASATSQSTNAFNPWGAAS